MTSNPRPGTRILGSLRSADGKGVVRIEDRYDTDIDDLWSAITDPGRLARWFGQVEGDLRPGGAVNLSLDGVSRIGQLALDQAHGGLERLLPANMPRTNQPRQPIDMPSQALDEILIARCRPIGHE